MTSDESKFFELLDTYARTRYECFLAEMTFHNEERGYALCFRPVRISDEAIKNLRESTDDNVKERLAPFYACKYLNVSTECVNSTARRRQLPSSLLDQLDAELPKLKQTIADSIERDGFKPPKIRS
jgi:hypothetical protein